MSRILIIEDHPDLALLFSLWAKLAGHLVETRLTGFQAVQALRKFRPATVLLDLGLPGIDGWGVARAIRRDSLIEQPKLVAISAYDSEADRERSKRAGIDLHLPKPIDSRTFFEMLANVAPRDSTSGTAVKLFP